MTVRVQKTLIEDICVHADVDESDVHYDYSGRFMYGRNCLGVVGITALAALLVEVGYRRGSTELGEPTTYLDALSDALVNDVQRDDFGRDVIYYFPRVQVADDPTSSP